MRIRWDTHELSVPIVARSSVLSERASSFAVPVTHGARLRSLTLPNVRLTETQHAGHVRLPRHAHSHAAITFVLDGAFTETFGSTTHMCGPLALLFKPAHAEHVNAYASEGARSFIIEPLSQMTNELALFESLEHHTPQRGAACLAPLALQLYARFRREDGDLAFECEELALRLVAAAPAPLPGATRRAPAWLRDIEEMRCATGTWYSLTGSHHGDWTSPPTRRHCAFTHRTPSSRRDACDSVAPHRGASSARPL